MAADAADCRAGGGTPTANCGNNATPTTEPQDTDPGRDFVARKVAKVTAIETDDPGALHFQVEPTKKHSAMVSIPRTLVTQVQHLVQPDELAILVLFTTGIRGPGRKGVRPGTEWGLMFGCGSCRLGILDELRRMSPQLQLKDSHFRRICEKIAEARRKHSSARPRVVIGMG